MQTQRQPAYVESFDAFDFPGVDVHTSSLDPPFLHERVDLTWGQFVDEDQLVEGWVVTRGFLRVAAAKVESADNPRAIVSKVAKWISEQQERDRESGDWHSTWRAQLAGHPAVEAALSRGASELYRRANLTQPQELAMRQLFAGHSNSEAATALHTSERSYRDLIMRAVGRILALDG
ncbi:MAG TPA: hypothetical protein VGU71_22370 [Candidatus Dormibacteraeota bacterium]|nr:hypothetical protein [Candidatus Dormibacteraeota bacterium]